MEICKRFLKMLDGPLPAKIYTMNLINFTPWARYKAKHIILCLVLVQPRNTGKHPDMTEKC